MYDSLSTVSQRISRWNGVVWMSLRPGDHQSARRLQLRASWPKIRHNHRTIHFSLDCKLNDSFLMIIINDHKNLHRLFLFDLWFFRFWLRIGQKKSISSELFNVPFLNSFDLVVSDDSRDEKFKRGNQICSGSIVNWFFHYVPWNIFSCFYFWFFFILFVLASDTSSHKTTSN